MPAKKKLIDMTKGEWDELKTTDAAAGDVPDLHEERGKKNGKPPKVNGHKRGISKPAPIDAAAVLAALPAPIMDDFAQELMLPLDQIVPSAYNPRRAFDEGELRKLADSLRDHGQMQNCVVRRLSVKQKGADVYELIAGERRWKAAQLIALAVIRCRVIVATDAQAIELAGIENYRREQLNAIEEATWFDEMIRGAGHTQQQLAEKLGISQGQVANRLGLLKLPEAWRARIISGEIPATWARELAPWAEQARVVAHLDAVLMDEDERELMLNNADQFGYAIEDAISFASRPLEGYFSYVDTDNKHRSGNVAFKATKAQLAELDVKSVKRHGKNERRAFNLDLWEQLQAEALKASRQANKGKGGKSRSGGASPTEDRNAWQKRDAARRAKEERDRMVRLHVCETVRDKFLPRIEILSEDEAAILHFVMLGKESPYHMRDWLKAAITSRGGRIIDGYDGNGHREPNWSATFAELSTAQYYPIRVAVITAWLSQPAEAWGAKGDLAEMMQIGAMLGVDVLKQWRPDQHFLDLFEVADLVKMAKEWKVKVPKADVKDKEKVRQLILDGQPVTMPKCVIALLPKAPKPRKAKAAAGKKGAKR